MAFRLDHIAFGFPGRRVFTDLSLILETGHFYGIIGPNGCGKTTLLDLMARLRQPSAGQIRFGEQELTAIAKKKLARQIALVPQNFYINFPFTAHEVVMMGRYPHIPRFSAPSSEDTRTVQAVMESTDTEQFSDRLITELSGGERQRVVFARALAQNTPVMILDEATSNMDINHALNLLSLTADRVNKKGTTVIAVFQDINLAAMFCDQLIFMKDGCISAQGPTNSVFSADTVASIFHVKAMVRFEPFVDANQALFHPGGLAE
ncbi:MAG: ABC transporter ATP-binding protein [Desulfobacteraceae bacterium]|nr:ABC transporter ATP-binding protein [Desulfobacteraceae bacterium]